MVDLLTAVLQALQLSDNYLTEVGNLNFVFFSISWLIVSYRWRTNGSVHASNRYIVEIIDLIILGVLIRIAWWAFALKLAPDGATYHPFFLQWKWIPTLLSSWMYGMGIFKFIQVGEGFNKARRNQLMLSIFLLSTLIGLI